MPSTSSKNWNKMKKGGGGGTPTKIKKKNQKKRYFSTLPKQNQSIAGTVYRRSVQRRSHPTRGLASCIWHQLPRLDKQCLVGILNHLMQLGAVLQTEVCSSQLAEKELTQELQCKL